MIEFLINLLSTALLLAGVFLGISGAVGLFRFPDFFSRMHAAGITDTLCTACIIGGLVLQSGFSLITVKLIFILLFTWYTSPAAGHALIKAANKTGLRPLLRKDSEQEANKHTDNSNEPKDSTLEEDKS